MFFLWQQTCQDLLVYKQLVSLGRIDIKHVIETVTVWLVLHSYALCTLDRASSLRPLSPSYPINTSHHLLKKISKC